MRVGELAEQAGLSSRTIRFCKEVPVSPSPRYAKAGR